MAGNTLNVTLIQADIVWEDKKANLKQYQSFIESVQDKKEVVVLPEMFSTGFSMNTQALAEPMDGPTAQWMKNIAKQHRCILTGSLIIEDEGKYYNRLLWVQPDGVMHHYDKRHLFAYADEHNHFTPGDKRLIVSVKGFRICPMVCYDLRFPVWARNRDEEYDVLLYVANWPERRNLAWKTLLPARAIENLSYVIGVNRVGLDAKGLSYTGDSAVYGPLGEELYEVSNTSAVHTITLEIEQVDNTRAQLPFLNDADNFLILGE
jgi:predicted amidohydrolase